MVGVPVERTEVAELSAMGVAHLAGVSAGCLHLRRPAAPRSRRPGVQAFALRRRIGCASARRGRARSRGRAVWRFTEQQAVGTDGRALGGSRNKPMATSGATARSRSAAPSRFVSGATGPLIGLVLLCVFLSSDDRNVPDVAQLPERHGSDHGARRDGHRHDARDPHRRHRPFGRLGARALRHGDGLSRRQPSTGRSSSQSLSP